MCNIKPIRTENDFDVAVARLYSLIGSEPGTPEGDEYEILGALVEMYDATHYHIDPPQPSVASDIVAWLDRQGLTPPELNSLLGPGWDIPALLAGKQAITVPMAKGLYEKLEVRPESLFQAMVLDAPVADSLAAAD